MAAGTIAAGEHRTEETAPIMVSGYAAIAESPWMGAAQATDVLEPINLVRRRLAAARPRLPRRSLTALSRRELSIAEASIVLMTSFLLSAVLGAIRQILFNAQFGAGSDTAFASEAAQSAALPAIQNAFLLVGLPIALLGQAVGQSAFPRIAGYAEAGEWRELRRTLLRSLGGVLILAVPALAFLILAGRRIVHVLFEHGHYGTAAGSLTYHVLVSYAIALPAYVAAEVLSRGLIALRDTRTLLLTNTAQVIGRVLIMLALLGSVGALAIPRAFALMATAESLALGGVLFVRVRNRAATLPALSRA